MKSNNWERLNIWLKLYNKFDYVAFKKLCESDEVEPLGCLEFAQKSGMVSCALVMYPDLPITESYIKLIRDNAVVATPSPRGRTEAQKVTAKGCCGGGKVR